MSSPGNIVVIVLTSFAVGRLYLRGSLPGATHNFSIIRSVVGLKNFVCMLIDWCISVIIPHDTLKNLHHVKGQIVIARNSMLKRDVRIIDVKLRVAGRLTFFWQQRS